MEIINFKQNQFIEPIRQDEKLWKYLSFTKFMDLLETSCLHFCSVNNFDDAYEGKALELTHDRIKSGKNDLYKNIHDNTNKQTYINCWSLNNDESYAMWYIYAGRNDGISIQTSVKSLKKSILEKNKNVEIVKVKYIDYKDNVYDDNILNLINDKFYACKSKEYEYEKEVRVVMKQSNANDSYEKVRIDIEKLIENIYVHPKSEEWFIELLYKILTRYKIKKNICHSNIVRE